MSAVILQPQAMDINSLISYLEKTNDDQWQTDVCRSKDGKRNCVMGHLFNWAGGDGKDSDGRIKGSLAWDWFESVYATTYMIYPVNDGSHPAYPQATPKERILIYLKNLRDGKEKTTLDHEKECFDERK